MMAFTERGFIWIKTIENKRGKLVGGEKKEETSSSQSQMQNESKIGNINDNQEIKYENVEKAFEHIFLMKKESWQISIEKLLANEEFNRNISDRPVQDQNKIDSLKIIQENNDPNIVIEISSKSKNNVLIQILKYLQNKSICKFSIIYYGIQNRKIKKKSFNTSEQLKSLQNCQKRISLSKVQIENKRKILFVNQISFKIQQSPLGVLTIEGSTYEFGDYVIRIGKHAKLKKVKIQIEYTPSKFDIVQNQSLEDYANKVIKPVLHHIFQNFEEFKDIRDGTSEKEIDNLTQEPKYYQLTKELLEIPHPFKSTRFFIKNYFDDTFSK